MSDEQNVNEDDNSRDEKMPSLNHSYTCFQLMRQLMGNENIYPLPELTLDIANGVTPDISVFPKEHISPNFFNDIIKFRQAPVLAIEVISPTQSIQAMLEKARMLVSGGSKRYGRSNLLDIMCLSSPGTAKNYFITNLWKMKASKLTFQIFSESDFQFAVNQAPDETSTP